MPSLNKNQLKVILKSTSFHNLKVNLMKVRYSFLALTLITFLFQTSASSQTLIKEWKTSDGGYLLGRVSTSHFLLRSSWNEAQTGTIIRLAYFKQWNWSCLPRSYDLFIMMQRNTCWGLFLFQERYTNTCMFRRKLIFQWKYLPPRENSWTGLLKGSTISGRLNNCRQQAYGSMYLCRWQIFIPAHILLSREWWDR